MIAMMMPKTIAFLDRRSHIVRRHEGIDESSTRVVDAGIVDRNEPAAQHADDITKNREQRHHDHTGNRARYYEPAQGDAENA